jgi:hypothetical protein
MSQNCSSPSVLRRHSLGRDIAWALAVKTAALVILYFAFFGPSHRVEVTPGRVAADLFDPAQSLEGR